MSSNHIKAKWIHSKFKNFWMVENVPPVGCWLTGTTKLVIYHLVSSSKSGDRWFHLRMLGLQTGYSDFTEMIYSMIVVHSIARSICCWVRSICCWWFPMMERYEAAYRCTNSHITWDHWQWYTPEQYERVCICSMSILNDSYAQKHRHIIGCCMDAHGHL